ncbi:MAG: universal stress protein, partial [Acetobacteraceae bacterium]
MRFKDILVTLDPSEQSATRLTLAADLARRHDAHLTGLLVVDVMTPMLMAGDGGAAVLGDLLAQMREDALAAAATVETVFRETLRRQGLAGEWRLVEGFGPGQVAMQARYADLTILGQPDPDGGQADAAAMLEQAIFASGRPVLVVPYAGQFGSIGHKVLVGWNAGREAARALNDALPILAQAESVTVFAINPAAGEAAHGEEPGADIALHLARHGVTVAVERTEARGIEPGAILLNQAADTMADLLVVGAYGHSRLREMVLG